MDKATVAPVFVGIDVAKHRLDVHLRPSDEHLTVDHGEEEVAALVVLEATGGLEVLLGSASLLLQCSINPYVP